MQCKTPPLRDYPLLYLLPQVCPAGLQGVFWENLVTVSQKPGDSWVVFLRLTRQPKTKALAGPTLNLGDLRPKFSARACQVPLPSAFPLGNRLPAWRRGRWVDSCFRRSNFDHSLMYGPCLCSDRLYLPFLPASRRSSLHSGCFFLSRTIFMDSLPYRVFIKHLLSARHCAWGTSYPISLNPLRGSYYSIHRLGK